MKQIDMHVYGPWALVTGASSGIGEEFAHLDLGHHFGQRLAQRGRGGIVLVSAAAAADGLPYKTWRDRGARFLTAPDGPRPGTALLHARPDGHLIEVGQRIPA